MKFERVKADSGVTLVGGAQFDPELLQKSLKFAPFLVAADSGADRAIACGETPKALIGDLDSVSDAAKAAIGADATRFVADQNTTDFEKCLSLIDSPRQQSDDLI